MKTLQSGICCLFFFAALLFATPGNANNIVEGKAETTVGQQLADMMNNPQLADYGISEAELYLQFTVRDNGELLLLAINTDNEYLIDFANNYFKKDISAADVVWTYSGVRPLYDDGARDRKSVV